MTRSVTIFVGQSSALYTFHVTAINTGAEAVTIADVGIARVGNNSLLASVAALREKGNPPYIPGPRLPARLEAHGALTWAITGTLIEAEGDEQFRAYADRFQPLAPGRESHHKYSYSSTRDSINVH